jgi:transposase
MRVPLVTDELWALVAPLLPERPPRPKGGRPSHDDRKVLEGIVVVLRTPA